MAKKRSTRTFALSLGALGVVYGDIGTSPIYALEQSVAASGTSRESLLGVASLVFWTLMIVVSMKYLLIVLRVNNHGEGGALALLALLPAKIRSARKGFGAGIVFMMLIAAAFLFADGLLTPAISVISAVEGLVAINEGFELYVVPITVAILVVMFFIQSRGSGFLGKVFSPAMVVWFLTIGAFGVFWIIKEPSALAALNPSYAIGYVASSGWHIFIVMASIILVVTGAESLYADLGHFGKRPIQIGWFGFVGIALSLSYFGQAARLIAADNPDEIVGKLFFSMAPDQFWLYFLVVIATIATTIASQALISGVQSLASQAIEMGLIPRMKVVHTSVTERGQIFVPFINGIVGIGAIFLVIAFGSSAALSGAYAFAIAGTMLITTIALFFIARAHLNWKPIVFIPILSVFLIFDIAFFVSTSTKLFHGAWLPLVIGFIVASIMWIWQKGRRILANRLVEDSMTWQSVAELRKSDAVSISEGTGVYLSAVEDIVPQSLETQIKVLHSLPRNIVIVNITTSTEPYATEEPQIEARNEWLSFVTATTGFMEQTDIPAALRTKSFEGLIDEAKATYFLTSRKFINPKKGELNYVEDMLFATLHRNSGEASEFFRLPQNRVITISQTMDL